jgi:PPM family protein phosphatase
MAVWDWFRGLFGSGRAAAEANADGGRPARAAAARPFRVKVGQFSDKGKRDNNEDNLFVDVDRQLFMVADGMGGQAAGEVASALAIDAIPAKLAELESLADENAARDRLRQAFVACNDSILARGAADPNAASLGTTAVVVFVVDEGVAVAHVGDSRAYRLRKNELQRLTDDHNLAEALYRTHTIDEEELKTHRYKNVLYKYLGMKDQGVEPDIQFLEARSGDRFLLASDGVTGSVSDTEMIALLRLEDPEEAARKLVELAIGNGSKDNATSVVLHLDAA